MELTRKDTKMLQAMSVLAMLCLHLFDRLELKGLYKPLIYTWGGYPLTYILGQLSDFCVMGFAFCTGYAHYLLRGEKGFYRNRLKGLLSVLAGYWVVLTVFSAVGIFVGKGNEIPGSVDKWIMHFFLLDHSYNGAWWYMLTYTLLVLLSPGLMKLVKKLPWFATLSIGFTIYCGGYFLRFQTAADNWLLNNIGPFAMTLFEYLIGSICAKCMYFTKIHKLTENWNTPIRITVAALLWLAMLYGHSAVVKSLFIAPATGIVIISLFVLWRKSEWVEKVFLFIGEHSTNLWLTHMFFLSTLFNGLVFLPEYPILIYLWLIALTIGTSMVIQLIQKPIQQRIRSW